MEGVEALFQFGIGSGSNNGGNHVGDDMIRLTSEHGQVAIERFVVLDVFVSNVVQKVGEEDKVP